MPLLKKSGTPTASNPRKTANAASESSAPRNKGWGAVAKRKAQVESGSSKNKPVYLDVKNKFFLTDGETVMVQFLNDEPICVEGVLLPPDFRDFYVSRKDVDRHCPFVENKMDLTWKAFFKVLDYRGSWDKDKKEHKYDKPVEKYWACSNTVAMQLKAIVDRKGKDLSRMVFDVTRSGADKSTTYNFEIALNEDDIPFKPIAHVETLPKLEVALTPLPRKTILTLLGEDDNYEDEKDVI